MNQIEDWLMESPSGHEELVVLGASAGWMMSPIFLTRFRRVVCVDLDWLGGLLFRTRFRRLFSPLGRRLHYQLGDAHVLLPKLLCSYPKALILFDNFLGLDSLYTRDLEFTQNRMSALKILLRGRAWGSLHDRLSGPAPVFPDHPPCVMHHRTGTEIPEIDLIRSLGGSGQWLDHTTATVFPDGLRSCLIAWPITLERWHWLEAAWVPAASQSGE